MRGVDDSDPSCIHNVDELEKLIDEIGFLPLFAGDVPGFSVEERTVPKNWWSDDSSTDPWMWREMIARRGHIAYGKFFNNRAGFISKEWLPVFANYRRDGYDFDARWDDELASFRQKKIMDLFMEENKDAELFSFEVKSRAGFGKSDGEKNFEGTLTSLEMQTYLVCSDFRQRKNKKGELYGWHIAILATPEHVFGEELVRSGYEEEPKDSLRKIVNRVQEYCPDAAGCQILKLVAFSEDRRESKTSLRYPRNLLKVIDKEKDPWSWSDDQISGLYVALGQLRPKQQRVLWEKYHDGLKNEEIGEGLNRAAGTISAYHGKAMGRLRHPLISAWYRDGYAENLKACAVGRRWQFDIDTPGTSITEDDLCLRIGIKVDTFERLAGNGIIIIRDLIEAMKESNKWYKGIYGIGEKTAEDMVRKLEFHGII